MMMKHLRMGGGGNGDDDSPQYARDSTDTSEGGAAEEGKGIDDLLSAVN